MAIKKQEIMASMDKSIDHIRDANDQARKLSIARIDSGEADNESTSPDGGVIQETRERS